MYIRTNYLPFLKDSCSRSKTPVLTSSSTVLVISSGPNVMDKSCNLKRDLLAILSPRSEIQQFLIAILTGKIMRIQQSHPIQPPKNKIWNLPNII